jgi:lipopolysaccharide transport system permease protein
MRTIPTSTFLFPRRIIYLRDLMRELVIREMKLQYKSSILGVAWSLLNPLLQLLIFTFLFRVVMPLGIENYPAFLFSGMLAWTWFQLSLVQATSAITSHRELIRRPGFPAPILPAITVMTNLINMLLALPLLFIFMLISGGELKSTAFFLPLLMTLQFVFTLSIAYFLATVNVLFRDTQHIIGVMLQLLFFVTPVFYDGSRFPEKYQPLLKLNPMLHIIGAYRDLLLYGRLPNFETLSFIALSATLFLILGYKLFISMRDRFVEEL